MVVDSSVVARGFVDEGWIVQRYMFFVSSPRRYCTLVVFPAVRHHTKQGSIGGRMEKIF